VPTIDPGWPLDEVAEYCQNRDNAEAWEELIARTHRMVAGVIRSTLTRWGAKDSGSIDDLVQEVYARFSARQIKRPKPFVPHHPGAVLGYLKAVAASVAHDHCKSGMALKRGAGAVEATVNDLDIAASTGPEMIERKVLLREVGDIISEYAQRDQLVFWLYYRQGLTAAAIAAIPRLGLTSKGVESAINRLTRAVRERLSKKENPPGLRL
jgi:RNA polymerase sigma-70 factor, ECF subfamily